MRVCAATRCGSGGGYSYRLCPASEPLTEACFQKHPLDFVVDKQQLVLKNGSRIAVPKPVFVTTGTSPAGSMWSRMPIPGSGYGHRWCHGFSSAHARAKRWFRQ